MRQTAVYPGSFDPLTRGHLNIIERAAGIFEKVVVLVAESTSKSPLFTNDEKVAIIEEAVKKNGLKNISVKLHGGFTIDYFKKNPDAVCIRGLRSSDDYEHEYSLEQMNKQLFQGFETVFLTTDPAYSFISSTLIKEIVKLKGDVSQFVPDCVVHYLKGKIK